MSAAYSAFDPHPHSLGERPRHRRLSRRRILALAAALLQVALPAVAQGPQQPPAGTVLVVAAMSDGLTWVPLPGGIVVPPVACDPSG